MNGPPEGLEGTLLCPSGQATYFLWSCLLSEQWQCMVSLVVFKLNSVEPWDSWQESFRVMLQVRVLQALISWAPCVGSKKSKNSVFPTDRRNSGETELCPMDEQELPPIPGEEGGGEALFTPGIRAPGLWLLVFRDKLILLIW